jgi:hypothetical protein
MSNDSNVVPMTPPAPVPLFTIVSAERLRDIWDWVRPRLERVLVKNKETGWIPEDIYASVKSGVATLATIGEDDGIIVMQRQVRSEGPVLFIWVLEGEGLERMMDACFDEARRLAKLAGARKIIQYSPRKGWERVGFKATHTIYEMEV